MMENRIKQLRNERNLTQKELGKAIGIRGQAISFYELGRREPDKETLNNLSQFFDVSLAYLIKLSDDRHNKEFVLKQKTLDKLDKIMLTADLITRATLFKNSKKLKMVREIRTIASNAKKEITSDDPKPSGKNIILYGMDERIN